MKKRRLLALLGFSLFALTSCDISAWGTYQIIGYNYNPGGKGDRHGVYFHTGKGTEIEPMYLDPGSYIDLSKVSTTWEGHEFVRWYLDEKLTSDDVPEFMGDKIINLYACWTMDINAPRFLMGKYPTRYVKASERNPKKEYYYLQHDNAAFTASDGTHVEEDAPEIYFEYDYLSWNVHKDGEDRYLVSLDDATNPCYMTGTSEDHSFDNESFSYYDVFSDVEREHIFSIDHPVPKYDVIKDLDFAGASDYAKALGVSEEATNRMIVKELGEEVVYNTKTKTLSDITAYGEDIPYAYRPVLRYMEGNASFMIRYDRSETHQPDTYQKVPYQERRDIDLEFIVSDGYTFDENGLPNKTTLDYWEDVDTHNRYLWTMEEINDDVILYPHFKGEPFRETVNIRYHLGNDNATNDPSNPTKASFGSTLHLQKPTCPGEEFEAWYYDEGLTQYAGSTVIQYFGAWHAPDYRGIDLYAKWAPKVCNISYLNVETTNSPDNPIHYVHNQLTPLPLYAPSLNKSQARRFVGWKYEGNFVDEVSPEMMRNEGISLSGVWESVYSTEVFYLDYDFGGDDVICTNIGYYTTSYTSTTSSIRYPELSRPGYTLKGWSTDQGQTTVKTVKDVISHYDNVLLTAIWKEAN